MLSLSAIRSSQKKYSQQTMTGRGFGCSQIHDKFLISVQKALSFSALTLPKKPSFVEI